MTLRKTTQASREQELVARIVAGDKEAEELLFAEQELTAKVELVVRTNTKAPREDQHDLIAEILSVILVLLRQGKLDFSRGNIGSFCYGVARNKIREYYRTRSASRTDASANLETFPVEDKNEEKQHLHEQMANLTRQLDRKYQQIIILRYYEELSIEEISDQLQLTVKQVYNQLNYAIKQLRGKVK